jgi:hypothetical protein
MPDLAVNPEVVIQRLANQIGQMAAELAMRDAALEAAQGRIAELENPAEEVSDDRPAEA